MPLKLQTPANEELIRVLDLKEGELGEIVADVARYNNQIVTWSGHTLTTTGGGVLKEWCDAKGDPPDFKLRRITPKDTLVWTTEGLRRQPTEEDPLVGAEDMEPGDIARFSGDLGMRSNRVVIKNSTGDLTCLYSGDIFETFPYQRLKPLPPGTKLEVT